MMQSTLSLPGPPEHGAWLRNKRRQLLRILGNPASSAPQRGAVVEERKSEERILQRVEYEGEPGERISALLLLPRKFQLPLAAVLYLHSQGADKAVGKREAIAGGGLGLELCRRGYAVLAPDVTGYGERRDEDADVEAGRLLLGGWNLPAKTIWEMCRGIDYLFTRAEINKSRVGLLGMARGGFLGCVTAAVEPRIAAAAICWGVSSYASLLAHEVALGPMGWVPNLLNWGDMPEVCSMIAPRPLFMCAAKKDRLFPFAGFQEVHWRTSQLYARLGAAENLAQYILEEHPALEAEVLARVSNWFDRHL